MITYFDELYEPWMTTDLEIFDGWVMPRKLVKTPDEVVPSYQKRYDQYWKWYRGMIFLWGSSFREDQIIELYRAAFEKVMQSDCS